MEPVRIANAAQAVKEAASLNELFAESHERCGFRDQTGGNSCPELKSFAETLGKAQACLTETRIIFIELVLLLALEQLESNKETDTQFGQRMIMDQVTDVLGTIDGVDESMLQQELYSYAKQLRPRVNLAS